MSAESGGSQMFEISTGALFSAGLTAVVLVGAYFGFMRICDQVEEWTNNKIDSWFDQN